MAQGNAKGSIHGSTDEENWLYTPEFPNHWVRCSLYSLAEWVNGIAFKKIQFNDYGKPVIKIAEIKNGLSSQTKYTLDEFDESVHVRSGDLLFSWSGQPETSIGAFWWKGPDGWLNQHIFRVTPSPGVDEGFLYYLLQYIRPNFVGIARNKQTTGLGHITKRDLKGIEVAIPSYKEQRAIARLLAILDDKIELNCQMNETVEAIAGALFQSWFVDLDVVDAESNIGRHPKSYPTGEEGCNRNIDNILEDTMSGRVPVGWKQCDLGEVAEIVNGRSYKSEDLQDSCNALVTLKSFKRGGGYKSDGLKSYTGPFKPDQVIRPGDVVIACTDITQAAEVVGRPALVDSDDRYERLIASLDVLIVRPKSADITSKFLYHVLNTSSFAAYTLAHTTGTTVLHLSKKAVPAFTFICPPSELLNHFDSIVSALDDKAAMGRIESLKLAGLRDILLPRLFSGKLVSEY